MKRFNNPILNRIFNPITNQTLLYLSEHVSRGLFTILTLIFSGIQLLGGSLAIIIQTSNYNFGQFLAKSMSTKNSSLTLPLAVQRLAEE